MAPEFWIGSGRTGSTDCGSVRSNTHHGRERKILQPILI
jgi:hypothetical protein